MCCGYSFESHRQVDAIQMSTHNICLYKEADRKYTGCHLKTTELLGCALIGVCAVIRSNLVVKHPANATITKQSFQYVKGLENEKHKRTLQTPHIE